MLNHAIPRENKVQLACLNIRSVNNKIDDVRYLVQDRNIDVLTLCKTIHEDADCVTNKQLLILMTAYRSALMKQEVIFSKLLLIKKRTPPNERSLRTPIATTDEWRTSRNENTPEDTVKLVQIISKCSCKKNISGLQIDIKSRFAGKPSLKPCM